MWLVYEDLKEGGAEGATRTPSAELIRFVGRKNMAGDNPFRLVIVYLLLFATCLIIE